MKIDRALRDYVVLDLTHYQARSRSVSVPLCTETESACEPSRATIKLSLNETSNPQWVHGRSSVAAVAPRCETVTVK